MFKEVLLSCGYTEDDYIKIINNYSIKEYTEETLIEKFKNNTKFLKEYGYNDDDNDIINQNKGNLSESQL